MSRLMLCAVALVLLASTARADEAEDKAVKLVEKLGGRVTRDEKAPGKPVVEVFLANKQVTAADLRVLAPLTNLPPPST